MSDPYADPAHAAQMITACRTVEELDGYEAEARFRGIAPHEVTLILEQRRTLGRARG